ncbi:MAG: hypothetical protein GXC76_11200 [Rhodanobacteraceae bacterium]|jgi:uncharacterized protein (TIGR02001 family)|nr:hypothetical protein [Rhodanobacteraceae bacterium]
MNRIHTVATLGLAAIGATAAARAQAADAPPYAVSGNVAIVSDYLFRGLTQTWGGPAVQGGADLTLANGFAAGAWASSISDKSYPGASLELDLYANYGRAIGDDGSWRVGLYGYLYPNGNLDEAGLPARSFNTVEANAALTWKWLTLKYSQALTDYFGIDTEQGYRGDFKGSRYLQLDAAMPIDARWSLALHAGHTHVATRLATPLPGGATNPDYSDFGATLRCQLAPHWSASLGLGHATNAMFYAHTASFLDPADTRDVGGTRAFVQVQGTL